MYKRDRSSKGADSSGFEHVFVGEVSPDYKSGEQIVKGFHNWIQIYRQEILLGGKLNYRGYKRPNVRGLNSLKHDIDEEQVGTQSCRFCAATPDPPARQVLSIQFEWNGFIKPIGMASISIEEKHTSAQPALALRLQRICAPT
jgi:hypothetical protein